MNRTQAKIVFVFLLVAFCSTLVGCESTMRKSKELDAWMREHMW